MLPVVSHAGFEIKRDRVNSWIWIEYQITRKASEIDEK
jgi:hypothetical protein